MSLLMLNHPSKLVQWSPNAHFKTANFARHSRLPRPGPIHLCSFTFNDLYHYISTHLVDLFIIPYSWHAWLYLKVLFSGFSYREFPPLTFFLIQIPTCPLRITQILPSPFYFPPGTAIAKGIQHLEFAPYNLAFNYLFYFYVLVVSPFQANYHFFENRLTLLCATDSLYLYCKH